jgi:hypothetical protein
MIGDMLFLLLKIIIGIWQGKYKGKESKNCEQRIENR